MTIEELKELDFNEFIHYLNSLEIEEYSGDFTDNITKKLLNQGFKKQDIEFLEWFVDNSSCEEIEIVKKMYIPQSNGKISDGKIAHELSLNSSDNTLPFYKIIIPQEKPEQEVKYSKEDMNIKTAEEFVLDSYELNYVDSELIEIMVNFAKMHVQKALEAALNNAEIDSVNMGASEFQDVVSSESILTAYPLENIK